MRRPTMILMVVASALVIPGAASATWEENHFPIQQNTNIDVTGPFQFQGGIGTKIGRIECQTTTTWQLTAGTTTAHVSNFALDIQGAETVTDNCTLGEKLTNVGCTDVATVTFTGLPWVAHAVSTQTLLSTTGGTIQTHLHGGIFCPKTIQLTLGTSMHLTTATATTWSTAQPSGQGQVHTSQGVTETVTLVGLKSITPEATYGVS